jgi:hypothetical protein
VDGDIVHVNVSRSDAISGAGRIAAGRTTAHIMSVERISAMRLALLSAAALALLAGAAQAAPASVSVAIGPELQTRAEKDLGVREVREVADDLRTTVERKLARNPAFDGARVELTLVDVKPNRPTFHQLGAVPGLSFQSFGVGGASIEGQVVRVDGSSHPVAYHWYETDIRQAPYQWTWHDADWTFQRFASRLANGDQLAAR